MGSFLTGNRWYLKENQDFLWDINNFRKKVMAFDFVRNFESRICVYSPSLSQLYGKYSINDAGGDALVVLPEVYTTERFVGIANDAIKPTGIYIHPGWLFDLEYDFVMTLPVRHQGKNFRSKPIPIGHGFAIVNRKLRNHRFLPVILNGALREYRRTAPYLHLHRLELNAVQRSAFDREQIDRTIREKLTEVIPSKIIGDIYPKEKVSFSDEFQKL